MAKNYKKNWNKNKKKNKVKIFTKKNILGALIVFIMVSSGIGFGYMMNQEENYNYQGTKIYRTQNGYKASVDLEGNKLALDFTYPPSYLKDIELDTNILSNLQESPTFMIFFDPNDEQISMVDYARSDLEILISENTDKIVGSFVVNKNEGLYATFPVATCDNTTEFVPGIFIRSSEDVENASFFVEGNCLIFDARDEYDIVMLRDRLVYGLTGVIKS